MQTQNNWMIDIGVAKIPEIKLVSNANNGYIKKIDGDDVAVNRRMSNADKIRLIKRIEHCLQQNKSMTQAEIVNDLRKNGCIPIINGKESSFDSLRRIITIVKKRMDLYNPASKKILKLHDDGNSRETISKILNVPKRTVLACLVYHGRIKPLIRCRERVNDAKRVQVLITKETRDILDIMRKQKHYSMSMMISIAIEEFLHKHQSTIKDFS